MNSDDKRNEPTRLATPLGRDPWHALTALTPARIGLGRAGHALRTETELALRAAHAAARDAVQTPWDPALFAAELEALELRTVMAATRATSREVYLRRPDLGRALTDASLAMLHAERAQSAAPDVVIAVTNGLSSTGLTTHGAPLVRALVHALRAGRFTLGPLVLVPNARVATSDMIGEALGASAVLIVVGERPGLSAADSLGLYLTHAPHVGTTDAARNCISNIHPPVGLDYHAAAHKAAWLVREALTRGLSGVQLKDESPEPSPGLSLTR